MVNIIDCTIRDGGHLNKWCFPNELVIDSYNAAKETGVPFFEIGYRNSKNIKGLGAFGYCDDIFIDALIPDRSKTKLLVMIDVGKVELSDFKPASQSPFWGVRVACYPNDLEQAFMLAEGLLALGYHVFLNPMVTYTLGQNHYTLIKNWKSLDKIEALYVADSFGSFTNKNVQEILNNFRFMGVKKLGFHAHNNLQLAVSTTLTAISSGVSFVDATIYGMGRGAGNAPIEILTALLSDKNKFVSIPYLNTIRDWYIENSQDWGAKPQFVMSGIKRVHPNYAEELNSKASFLEMNAIMDRGLPLTYNPNAVPKALEILNYERI